MSKRITELNPIDCYATSERDISITAKNNARKGPSLKKISFLGFLL